MKKILSMILCLALVASALVSCGGGETKPPEADRPNRTLRMAIVVADEYTDANGDVKKTTQEGIDAMERVFNEQSEVLLATHVEFECIKASEYKARMTAIMNEVADEKARQSAGMEDAMANAGDSTGTVLEDEDNKFPAASKAQFDILMIYDEGMYTDFVKNGWLVGLNEHLSSTFKPLNTKILEGAKKLAMVNGECYGIPAIKAYGSYTYVKVNKVAASKYGVELDEKKFRSLTDAYQLITLMETAQNQGENGLAYWKEKYGDKFSVIGTKAEEFVLPNVQYLSSDLSSLSLFGATYDYKYDMSSISSLSGAKNLLVDSEYSRYLEMKFRGQLENYFLDGKLAEGETGEDWDCLFSIVKGDYALRDSDPDSDYQYIPIWLPSFEKSDEFFGGMIAVSSFTVDAKRSVEIVQELMTDSTKANLLNILLFGDAETNYYMEDNCVVYRKNSGYHVAQDYLFGNLREFAYPCKDFGQTAETYTYVAKHIGDLAQRQALFDDYFGLYFSKLDKAQWDKFDVYCTTAYEDLMDSANMGEYTAKLEALKTEMSKSDHLFFVFARPDATEAGFTSLGAAFLKYTSDRADDPTKVDPFKDYSKVETPVTPETTEPAA